MTLQHKKNMKTKKQTKIFLSFMVSCFLFSLILGIIGNMETWSNLPKSGTDNETIEQAINRIVGTHNDDSIAHTLPGQSIAEHSGSSSIDHPVGSIFADKRTMHELSIDHDFSNIGVWYKQGSVTNSDWPDCTLYVEYGDVDYSRMSLSPQNPSPFLMYNVTSVFQVIMSTDLSGSDFHAHMGFGLGDDTPTTGFGFVIQSGQLKAYIGDGSDQYFQDITGVNYGTSHLYRAQVMPHENIARFYIDGTLMASLSIPSTNPGTDGGPSIGARLSGNGDGNFIVSDLHFSRGLIPE